VLDYIVTSSHIHLLVKDTGQGVIAQSMQLIVGRTAQEYQSFCVGLYCGNEKLHLGFSQAS